MGQSEGFGFAYLCEALRYNRRHEILAETIDMGQFSSLSGLLDSQRRLAGWLGSSGRIARVAPASD